MQTKENDYVLENGKQRVTKVFDNLDKMPDISLKELYYVLKASRKRLKEKYKHESVDLGFSSI